MAAFAGLLLCSLLWILSPAEGKELTITCLASEDCALPCQFESDGKGARVMWYKKKAVVSCTRYGNTSFVVGHNSPAEKYMGRTGLYADQVLEGNATLVLRNVTPNDQGKYFCVTMTAPRTEESGIISLVVKSPVRDVDIGFNSNAVTCRADGIFPTPILTWSTDPPTDAQLLHNKTRIQKNKLGFYEIQSSLRLLENNTMNQTCICCVTTDTSKKTAFLKHEASIQASSGSEVTIPCSLPHSLPQSFNLTWSFRRSEPILSISSTGQKTLVQVWDQWKPRVFDGLSASRGLQLRSLTAEHQGAYTCEVSTPDETYVTWTDVTVAEDSTLYIYIYIITGLCYFLFMSQGIVAFLAVKMRGLERRLRLHEERGSETAETVETLNDAEMNGVEENADDGLDETNRSCK